MLVMKNGKHCSVHQVVLILQQLAHSVYESKKFPKKILRNFLTIENRGSADPPRMKTFFVSNNDTANIKGLPSNFPQRLFPPAPPELGHLITDSPLNGKRKFIGCDLPLP